MFYQTGATEALVGAHHRQIAGMSLWLRIDDVGQVAVGQLGQVKSC